MRYVLSRLAEYNRDLSYRIFLTDCLQAIANNTTKHLGVKGEVALGTRIDARWMHLIYPQNRPKPKPVDNRPAVEIASDIWNRARLSG